MKTITSMTADQRAMAEQSIQGAREAIARGELHVDGVQVKALTKANVMRVFPPGVRENAQRVLRGW